MVKPSRPFTFIRLHYRIELSERICQLFHRTCFTAATELKAGRNFLCPLVHPLVQHLAIQTIALNNAHCIFVQTIFRSFSLEVPHLSTTISSGISVSIDILESFSQGIF